MQIHRGAFVVQDRSVQLLAQSRLLLEVGLLLVRLPTGATAAVFHSQLVLSTVRAARHELTCSQSQRSTYLRDHPHTRPQARRHADTHTNTGERTQILRRQGAPLRWSSCGPSSRCAWTWCRTPSPPPCRFGSAWAAHGPPDASATHTSRHSTTLGTPTSFSGVIATAGASPSTLVVPHDASTGTHHRRSTPRLSTAALSSDTTAAAAAPCRIASGRGSSCCE